MTRTKSGTARDPLLPGEIVLVPFPFTDLSAAKSRPALVLSNEGFNASGADVIVCALTSNLANSAASVLVASDDLERGALAAPSRVKVAKLATLQKALVRKRVGRLAAPAMARVMRELEAVLG